MINKLVAEWVGSLSEAEVIALCVAEDVPCNKIMSIADIFKDPQFAARQNVLYVDDPQAGQLALSAAVPKMSRTPPQFTNVGPALGNANHYILQELLGLSPDACAELRAKKII